MPFAWPPAMGVTCRPRCVIRSSAWIGMAVPHRHRERSFCRPNPRPPAWFGWRRLPMMPTDKRLAFVAGRGRAIFSPARLSRLFFPFTAWAPRSKEWTWLSKPDRENTHFGWDLSTFQKLFNLTRLFDASIPCMYNHFIFLERVTMTEAIYGVTG